MYNKVFKYKVKSKMATIVEFNQYNQKFDLNSEVLAIKKWLESNWSIPEEINLLDFLELTKEIAIEVYSDFTDVYANYEIFEKFKERSSFVEKETNNKALGYTESLSLSLLSLIFGLNNYNERIYESIIQKVDCGKILQNKLINKNGAFKNLLPLNYENYIKDYESFKDQENLNIKNELKMFEGVVIQRNAGFELPIRLNICHVSYDDIDQGRKPLEVLCNTLLYHFGSIIMHNNTIDLIKEISLIDTKSPMNFEFEGTASEYLKNIYPNLVKIVLAEKSGKNADHPISRAEVIKEKDSIKELAKQKDLKQEYKNLLALKGL